MVSVIIIFLNAEKFIREAIESVFAQTDQGWELLLVDDGSSDSSTAIAKNCAAHRPEKVVYLEHPGHRNRGMSASRNLGIRNSHGEYIAFLDADDVWLPRKLEHQAEILNRYPEAAMVYGPGHWWHSWAPNSNGGGRDFVQKLGIESDQLVAPPRLLTLFLGNEGAVPSPSGVILRRRILEQIDGFEEELCNAVRGLYDDQAMYAKVCLKAPVFVSKECWYRYRQHPEACCAVMGQPEKHAAARLLFLSWLAAYPLMQSQSDGELRTVFRRQLWASRHRTIEKFLKPARAQFGRIKDLLKWLARATVPASMYHWARCRWRGLPYAPPVGSVRFGNLRRVTPVSRIFGIERGRAIDRYYIENFLARHADDIRGCALEVADNKYTACFGGDRVTRSEVLHVQEGTPKVTIVADLSSANAIPPNHFDCIILTQTLQFIYDARAAVLTLRRILKPGGVLLATLPGISQISRYDAERWGDYWRFTSHSVRRLFEEVFSPADLTVASYGNVLAAGALLQGLAVEELRPEELDYHDPDYELVITVRAVKRRCGA